MSKRVAVVLAGCGVYDGAEIYESVMTLYHLEQQGVSLQCFAPDMMQMHVINHLTGEVMPEQRNVLVEAARIVRGNIKALAEARAADFDALIVPGGFGVAKNLSDFAVNGADCSVLPALQDLARDFNRAGKPVGLVCIAPALAARIFGPGVQCTIGNDDGVAAAITRMGGEHLVCGVDQVVVDRNRKVVSTPAYMLAGSITEAAAGIGLLVKEVLALA